MPAPGEIANSVYDSTSTAIKVKVVSDTSSAATPSSIGDGLKLVTTAGTAEKLTASVTSCKAVLVQAKYSNTGDVAVGAATVVAASGVTRRGTILKPGAALPIAIDDVSKVYVDVTVNGEGVTYAYVN